MPIRVESNRAIQRLPENIFREIAYVVTGGAMEVHNRYGRFFGERTYKYELATECLRRGLGNVEVEVPIRVSFEDFEKPYFMDLLIDGGALFELKVADGLASEHVNQTLNYLYLSELNRGKVFNFGVERLQGRFVSTRLTLSRRRQYTAIAQQWQPVCAEGDRFRQLIHGLLDDWGGFLSLPAYQDAVTHFFGGEDHVIRPVAVVRDGKEITIQPVHLLCPGVAFKLTALPDRLEVVEEHMRRFLHHTKLRAIQWVNFYHHDIRFTTLLNEQ